MALLLTEEWEQWLLTLHGWQHRRLCLPTALVWLFPKARKRVQLPPSWRGHWRSSDDCFTSWAPAELFWRWREVCRQRTPERQPAVPGTLSHWTLETALGRVQSLETTDNTCIGGSEDLSSSPFSSICLLCDSRKKTHPF